MLLITGLSLVIPQLIRWIVDSGIRGQDLTLLNWAILALLLLTLVKGVLTFFEGRWSEVQSQNVAYDLRNEIHSKLAELSFAYHDQTENEPLSRAMQDVERIRFLTGRATLRLISSVMLAVGTAAVLLWMNPNRRCSAWPPSRCWPTVLTHLAGGCARFRWRSNSNWRAHNTAGAESAGRGVVVKAFAEEEHETESFEAANTRWFYLLPALSVYRRSMCRCLTLSRTSAPSSSSGMAGGW